MNTNCDYPVRRYEELRPDELAQIVREQPVAYWPLGLIEHHGWHLPIGFDGLKADRICQRCARRTGGVLLPVMWWGADGGHGPFLWTHYQSPEAFGQIVGTTARQLCRFGFRALILLAGHYPLKPLLDKHLPGVQAEFPDALLLWGTEIDIASPGRRMHGDHAAREETSFGLALLPELIDMGALRPGRRDDVWPGGVAPADGVARVVCSEPDDPLFSQAGEDARLATAEHGRESLDLVIASVTEAVNQFLQYPC
jgi:creatinine amidohydrolase/Fe(II)-dependent formamide hydrolase-like protein